MELSRVILCYVPVAPSRKDDLYAPQKNAHRDVGGGQEWDRQLTYSPNNLC